MWAIFKREFQSYFHGVYGAIYIGVMLMFAGFFTLILNYLSGSTGFEYTLNYVSLALLVLVPILSMRSIAEDRKSGTIQLLYALPLKMRDIVLGKYLALLAVTAIPVIVMCFYPIILGMHGDVYYLKAYVSLLMFFLLGAALSAVCLFLSSLTESMVVSAVLGIASCLVLYLINLVGAIFPTTAIASFIALCVVGLLVAGILFLLTKNGIVAAIAAAVCIIPTCIVYFVKSSLFENLFPTFLSKLALFSLFSNISYGSLPLTTILTYLAFIVFFVFLTIQSMEKKRWA